MSEEKQYAERDAMEMDCAGNHYCRHVSAMTREKLHSKSDIAAELGWRDMQIVELKAQRDALAAENAALKVFAETISEIRTDLIGGGSGSAHRSDMQAGIAVLDTVSDAFTDIETSATDAWINSMRADGVDKAIAHLHKKFEGTGRIGVPVMALESLAAQLRAGEPS